MGAFDSTTFLMGGYSVAEEGPPTEHTDLNGTQYVRKLICNWVDRLGLYFFLKGGTTMVAGAPVTTYPQAYPDDPSATVSAIDLTDATSPNPVVGTSGMISYKRARLNVTYTTQSGDLTDLTNNVSALRLSFAKEITTIKGRALKWADDSAPLDISQPYTIMMIGVSQTMRRLGTLPLSQIFTATQSPVNSVPIFGIPAGYVRFEGPGEADPAIQAAAVAGGNNITTIQNWDLTLGFTIRSIKWGFEVKTFGPSAGTIVEVKRADGSPLYTTSDLNALYTSNGRFPQFG